MIRSVKEITFDASHEIGILDMKHDLADFAPKSLQKEHPADCPQFFLLCRFALYRTVKVLSIT